jgi:hypothetical protein
MKWSFCLLYLFLSSFFFWHWVWTQDFALYPLSHGPSPVCFSSFSDGASHFCLRLASSVAGRSPAPSYLVCLLRWDPSICPCWKTVSSCSSPRVLGLYSWATLPDSDTYFKCDFQLFSWLSFLFAFIESTDSMICLFRNFYFCISSLSTFKKIL